MLNVCTPYVHWYRVYDCYRCVNSLRTRRWATIKSLQHTRHIRKHKRKIRYNFVDRFLHRLPTILKVRLSVSPLSFYSRFIFIFLILLLWFSVYFIFSHFPCEYVVCHVVYGWQKRAMCETKNTHFELWILNATTTNWTHAVQLLFLLLVHFWISNYIRIVQNGVCYVSSNLRNSVFKANRENFSILTLLVLAGNFVWKSFDWNELR